MPNERRKRFILHFGEKFQRESDDKISALLYLSLAIVFAFSYHLKHEVTEYNSSRECFGR
jgi:hypothetical protein